MATSSIAQWLPWALALVMFGMGASLTPADFFRVVRLKRNFIAILLAQLIGLPFCGLLLALGWAQEASLAAGLVLLSACPGGTTSNLFSHLARANVALSISLTAVAGLITVVSIPLWVNLVLWLLGEGASNLQLPFMDTLQTLVLFTLLPVLLGMQWRYFFPRMAAAAECWFSRLALAFMVLMTLGLMLSQGRWLWSHLPDIGLPVLMLNSLALLSGWFTARLLRMQNADAATAMIEVGIQNSAMAIVIASSLMQSDQAALPAAFYSLTMYLFGFGVVAWCR